MSFSFLRSIFSRSSGEGGDQDTKDDLAMESGQNNNGKESNGDTEDKKGEPMDLSADSTDEQPSPGSSRGTTRKSPAPGEGDPDSTLQTKKPKWQQEQGNTSSVNTNVSRDSLEEDECFNEEEMSDDDDYEISSVESDDDIGYAISDRETKMSSSASSESDLYPCEVLSTADIVKCMDEYVETANVILQLPTPTMRILLNHFAWDKEKLLENYFAAGDQELDKLFQDAGVVNPLKEESEIGRNVVSSSMNGGEEECEICFDQTPSSEMFNMKCGHRFCTGCWTRYLTTQIVEEGIGQTMSCIAHKCTILVDDATVMKLVTDSIVRSKYEHLITDSFVLCNAMLKWCPSPDCNYAVKVQIPGNGGRPVTCTCGHMFCFMCAADAHDPIRCDMLKKWLQKCADDSETSNWIAINTKECPKCHANIQKNGGCNHMHCRNKSCGAEFCWVCMGTWNNHDPYRCNRYNESDAQTARQGQEQSRAALHRYLHYFNRYANHMNSLKLESKLHDSAKDKMGEMMSLNMSWIEVQFLKNAVDTLCQCRQTLMYTYVFAFYVKKMTDNSQIEIFEANQEDLQAATELLSGFLERDVLSTEDLNEMKQKVQDMYKYCETRRQVLLAHVREGDNMEWWKFND